MVDENADVKVKATIEKVVSKTLDFTSKDITIKGKGNRKVTFVDGDKYSMTIEGVTSVVNAVKISDYEPWIDIEGLEDGKHELTVHVKEVEGTVVEKTAKVVVTLGE